LTVRCLGGCGGQVERSGYLLSKDGSTILLDYGAQLSKPPVFPLHVAPRQLDGFVVSHAHLDHTGGAPYLYISGRMPVYSQEVTMKQVDLLVRDFLKLSGPRLPYEFLELHTLLQHSKHLGYHEKTQMGKGVFSVELYNSGHIPGGASLMVETGKERLLYTSDINTYETRLMSPAETTYGELDAIICESTYAGRFHPDRKATEGRFLERVSEMVQGGGTVLIPTFAIGRSQEILLILHHGGYENDLYMDGMALSATRLFIEHSDVLKEPPALERAMESVTEVYRWKDRKKVVDKPGVIIAPAGMLGGGTAIFYMSRIYKNPKNAIFIVGFQAPGTPGKALVEEKRAYIRGVETRVEAEVESFKFSSHADQKGFEGIFKGLEGDPLVILVHGEESRVQQQVKFVTQEIGLKACAPGLGDEIEIGGNGPLQGR